MHSQISNGIHEWSWLSLLFDCVRWFAEGIALEEGPQMSLDSLLISIKNLEQHVHVGPRLERI
jgi:hypothetical protein